MLRVSHTTVGRRILAMEQVLGRQLFLRMPRSTLPTAECIALVAAAQETEAQLERLGQEERFGAAREATRFRITSVAWVVHRILLPRVPQLRDQLPGLQLVLDGSLSDQEESGLVPSLSLRFELPPDREETAVPVATTAYAVYGPANCAKPDDLPWISFDGQAALSWLERRGVQREEVGLLLTDGGAVRDAIAAGLGRGLIPVCLGEGDPRLLRLSGPEPEMVRLLRAVGRWQALQTPTGQAVIDWIAASFAEACGSLPNDRKAIVPISR